MKKTILAAICAALASTSVSFAHDKGMMKEPTKEQRATMAEAHQKMADCLKSDKTMQQCHEEMHQYMKDHGGMDCPMCEMGGGHKHGGGKTSK